MLQCRSLTGPSFNIRVKIHIRTFNSESVYAVVLVDSLMLLLWYFVDSYIEIVAMDFLGTKLSVEKIKRMEVCWRSPRKELPNYS